MLRFRLICAVSLVASSLTFVAVARAGSGGAESSGESDQLTQNFEPPGAIPGDAPSYNQPPANDAAALLVRIDRLEDQVRTLNGQIQQLQFDQQRLETALEKFQQDVDFRFQNANPGKEAGRPGKRSDASDGGSPGNEALASDDGSESAPPRHDDAFDPAAHPDAPGAPRALGSLSTNMAATNAPQVISAPAAAGENQSAAPDQGDDAGAPLQLDNGPAPPDAGQTNAPAPNPGPTQGDAGSPSDGTVLAGLPTNDPREDFDLALVSFNNGQFDQAQSGFSSFLERHPKDRLAPEATYYLGESDWRLGRLREAAEQYLKISTDYSRSPHAPESLLKLGLSLEKLGSRNQACASWAQIGRNYPTASAAVRASAERNMKRDQC